MSVKIPRRLSSKRKKPPKDSGQAEVLQSLGLDAFWTTPLDPVCMLGFSTWSLHNQAPLEPKDLPCAFLRRLWLLCPDARSPCCNPFRENQTSVKSNATLNGGEKHCPVNPLDLVTAVYMSANTFLQQEMTLRMAQCQFAVPLVLPGLNPGEAGRFLLWPLRAVTSKWASHFQKEPMMVQEGDMASTPMPLISCVRFGRCSVSKSQVLNHIVGGIKSCNETFLHKGMDGGHLPRRLSNGLVEIGWHLPTGDPATDHFPVPVAISNLRGDASKHEKCLNLLCQASSAVVIFCGSLKEKDRQLLASCKQMANRLILIDISDTEKNDNSVVGFVGFNLEKDMGLPDGSVLQGQGLSEEELATRLNETLKDLLPDKLTPVTLDAAANLALEQGINVDEGTVCKKAMASVDKVLEGFDNGAAQFMEKHLPLQGPMWRRLAEIERQESKLRRRGDKIDQHLIKGKKDIFFEIKSYKMTPAMKTFTNALFTSDKVERTYFLNWMKLKLKMKQIEKQNIQQEPSRNLQTEDASNMLEYSHELAHGANGNVEDNDSFFSVSIFEENNDEELLNVIQQASGNTGQELEHCQNTSLHEDTDSKSTNDPVKVQQLDMMSEGKEIPSREMDEHSMSDQLLKSHSSVLESPENEILSYNGTAEYEPELTPSTPDSTSSTKTCLPSSNPDPLSLGLEHFLREMSLIFELTHISPISGSLNVSRLPSLAAELLLYGIPLELMDGDASNIPIRWLGCVFAELIHRLSQEQLKTRVLTNIGIRHARNGEVLSALFGLKFPDKGKRTTRGLYMAALCVPDKLRKKIDCDFLFLICVKGLSSVSQGNILHTQISDNVMTTVATGLSDVLVQNVSSHSSAELEADVAVIANALLRVKEFGSVPICQVVVPNEGIYTSLQALQLKHVSEVLQTMTRDRTKNHAKKPKTKNTTGITCIKGPWSNVSVSEPVDRQYSEAVLRLKKNIFQALRKSSKCGATNQMSAFMGKLRRIWDTVKEDSFSIGLQDTEIASAFTLMCTEFSQWEAEFSDHMENWSAEAQKKISSRNEKASDSDIQKDLSQLRNEARDEVKTEADKLRLKVRAYLSNDDILKVRSRTFESILIRYVEDLEERATDEILQKLETVTESHCSVLQVKRFENFLEKEKETKILELIEKSNSGKFLCQDEQLEKEFEDIWNKALSNFDFRSSKRDDITVRVKQILEQNLISRGLLKHIHKIAVVGHNQIYSFQVYDDHFGYRTKLKNNNQNQRLEAQQLACSVIEDYKQSVADKCRIPADFSKSYITEVLEIVENALKKKAMEIKTAFEVDLKVCLCCFLCQDFQKVHNRSEEDIKLLSSDVAASKNSNLARFIYQFRKRDQCGRMAQAFTSMVIKPTVLDYIHRPLGLHIVEEIQAKEPQYQSSNAFNYRLLEEIVRKDESFQEYLLSYDSFRLRKIQETVVAHLSESTSLNKLRRHRLGEIIGKIAAAVSETAEGTDGVLSDAKPLLERVCLILESDINQDVNRAPLDGPLFSITTEWDRFVACLMELLAGMRFDLAKEFTQKVDVDQLLDSLPVQPQYSLMDRVRGCEKQCPFCRAPCELQEKGHEIHTAVLHRPNDVLPSGLCSVSTCPESIAQGDPDQNKDTQSTSMACRYLNTLHPDWNSYPEDQEPSTYWRYVLVKYNEKFATEYERDPASISEEWKKITMEEALESLKEAFLTKQC